MFRTLRWRIPIFVCALIVAIVTTLLVVSHREIESTLVAAARDRAAGAARQSGQSILYPPEPAPTRAGISELRASGEKPRRRAPHGRG